MALYKVHKTKHKGLGYTKIEDGLWQFIDISDAKNPAQVGQFYPTKESLLLDLENYAGGFGA